MNTRQLIGLVWMLCLAALLPGCALSRADQLARQSDRVESKLIRERDRVNASRAALPDAAARLDHLNELRTQLTVADTARKLAPRLLQDPNQVEAAYDVFEEVYSTIEWNIPLAPGDTGRRSMPSLFGPSGLDFGRLAPSPQHAR